MRAQVEVDEMRQPCPCAKMGIPVPAQAAAACQSLLHYFTVMVEGARAGTEMVLNGNSDMGLDCVRKLMAACVGSVVLGLSAENGAGQGEAQGVVLTGECEAIGLQPRGNEDR